MKQCSELLWFQKNVGSPREQCTIEAAGDEARGRDGSWKTSLGVQELLDFALSQNWQAKKQKLLIWGPYVRFSSLVNTLKWYADKMSCYRLPRVYPFFWTSPHRKHSWLNISLCWGRTQRIRDELPTEVAGAIHDSDWWQTSKGRS